MKIKQVFGTLMIWALSVSIGFSISKPIKEMVPHGGPDKVAADEQLSKYPALDLEDLCKQSKNPKCEAVIDSFCAKSCTAKLCEKHGSIRGMCRLMCEAEDLLPECSKMGSSGARNGMPQNQPMNPYQNQQLYQQGYLLPQN